MIAQLRSGDMGDSATKIALWAPFRGKVGTEYANIQYARSLRDSGYQVILISLLDEYDAYNDEFEIISLWTKEYNWIGKSNFLFRRDFFLLALLSVNRLKSALTEQNINIIISGLLSSVCCRAVKNTKVKLVISVQGYPKFLLEKDNIWSRIENVVRKRSWNRLYGRSSSIITMTENTRRQLCDEFPKLENKLKQIGNPLFKESVRIRGGDVSCDCLNTRVVFVGRNSYQKNFTQFYNLAIKCQDVSDLQFDVYGEFDASVQLRYKLPNLKFHGFVTDHWKKLCPTCTVHCVTSHWEDPGHAMLESLVRGIKTVVLGGSAPHIEVGAQFGAIIVDDNDLVETIRSITGLKSELHHPTFEEVLNLSEEYGEDLFRKRIIDLIEGI